MGFLPRPVGSKSRSIVGEVQSAFGYLRRQLWTAPDAAADDAVHAAITLTTAVQNIATAITNPDFPRKVTVTGTKAGGSLTGNVVITGTNIRDQVISETIAITADTEVEGTKAFKTVTNIQVPVRATSGDTVKVGISDALGLDRCMSANEVLLAAIDGVYETTRPTVTFDADEVEKNTVNPNTALDANVDLLVDYVSTERTQAVQTTA